jgi:DNA-binding transcriptional MerR regulator
LDRKGGKQVRTSRNTTGQRFTIASLARAAGLPTTTLRYYERAGLLEAENRSPGNYRLYSDESLRRLKFVRAAQAIGFTLDDVKQLLGSQDGKALSCREVQSLVEERLSDIEKRLKDLRDVERVLKSSLARCRKTERTGCCHVIETLQGSS